MSEIYRVGKKENVESKKGYPTASIYIGSDISDSYSRSFSSWSYNTYVIPFAILWYIIHSRTLVKGIDAPTIRNLDCKIIICTT